MKMLRRVGVVGGLLCALVACGDDAKETSAQIARGETTGMQGDGIVRGAVTRTIAPSKQGDGRGPLHITLQGGCLAKAGTRPQVFAKIDVDEVDLSKDDASVPFEITGVPDGSYEAAAWFDDVVNPKQDEDLPGKGDLAMFKAATPVCVAIVIKNGHAVEGVKLALNYEMPFDLTGTNADARGGVLDSDGGAGVDPADIDYDDPNTYEVTFSVTRSVAFGEGGDGIGDLLFTLSDICFDPNGGAPLPLHSVEKAGADLSGAKASVSLTFKGVKNGIYQINGYLNDVGKHAADRPLPDTGDLVRFGGFGPGCVEVAVNGGNVTATFDLNFLMTWDLNG